MGDETLLEEVEQSIYRAELAALKAQATALSALLTSEAFPLTSEAFPPGIVPELLEWLQHAANDLHYAYGIVRRAREQMQPLERDSLPDWAKVSYLRASKEDDPSPSPSDSSGFQQFIGEVHREALGEGPAAVQELEDMRAHFRLERDKLDGRAIVSRKALSEPGAAVQAVELELSSDAKKALSVGSADALSKAAGVPPKPKRKSSKRTR